MSSVCWPALKKNVLSLRWVQSQFVGFEPIRGQGQSTIHPSKQSLGILVRHLQGISTPRPSSRRGVHQLRADHQSHWDTSQSPSSSPRSLSEDIRSWVRCPARLQRTGRSPGPSRSRSTSSRRRADRSICHWRLGRRTANRSQGPVDDGATLRMLSTPHLQVHGYVHTGMLEGGERYGLKSIYKPVRKASLSLLTGMPQ